MVIDVEETEPVEPSLTIVLRGGDVEGFKQLINEIEWGATIKPAARDMAYRIRKELS